LVKEDFILSEGVFFCLDMSVGAFKLLVALKLKPTSFVELLCRALKLLGLCITIGFIRSLGF